MVVLSKFFNEDLKNCHCNDIIHLNGCLYDALYCLYRFAISNAIYFVPVIFMPLLLKIKKLNSELIWDTLKYYVEAIVGGTLVGWTTRVMMCVMRNLLGEFRMYTLAFVPSMIGGLVPILVNTKRVNRLFFISTIQCAIETLLIKRKNPITKLIGGSLSIKTFIFMWCSALILHAKRHNKFKGFWFLKPNTRIRSYKQQAIQREECNNDVPQNTTTISNPNCTHEESNCYLYLIKGVRNYMMIGLTLDSIKMFMSKNPTSSSSFLRKVFTKIKTCNLRTTAFLTSYIGIYRFMHCYLNRKTNYAPELNHILAAFFGGSAFMLYPKLTLQCYGLVLSMEILHKRFTTFRKDKSSKILEFIKHLPLVQIVFILSLANQIHTYILREQYVGSLATTFINGISDNLAKRMKVNVQRIEQSL